MKSIMIVLFVALSMSSCAMHEFKSGDPLVALELSKESSKAACYQAQAMNGPDYTKLGDMAIMAIEQQKAMIQIVGAITGKNLDPCSGGTNLNDVVIADSNNRNRTAQVAIDKGAGVVTTGIITTGVVAGVSAIGKNSGTKVDTGGGDSTVSMTRTSSKNTEISTAKDEGTASTGGGGTGLTTDPAITTDTTGTDPVIVTDE